MENHQDHADHKIVNPGPFLVPRSMTLVFLVMVTIGVIAFVLGLMTDPVRAWVAFVQNHFYFMTLALLAGFFVAIQWLTSSMWSAPIRRLAEAISAYLPAAFLTTVVLFFGLHHLYHWSHVDVVAHDLVLQGKSGYLNVPFFIVRSLIGLLVMIVVTMKMVGNSIAQDKDGQYAWSLRNRTLAPGFLILFALIFTMFSFDQVMSLDAHWFSTMFGVYCFAGAFYAVLALTCLMAMHFRGRGQLAGIVNDNHIHDLGKFMFGMTIFWAYIGFSQFMLIWYANLTEETGFFLTRMHAGWMYVSCFLAFGKFMVPFFLLLPRDSKRNVRLLTFVAMFMLVAQWIDILWIVQPNFYKEGPVIGPIEMGVAIGFVGLFGFMVTRFLGRHNLVAIGDPRLQEAVFHHHQ